MAAKSGPGRRRRVVRGEGGTNCGEDLRVAGIAVVTLVVESSLIKRSSYRNGDLPGGEVADDRAATGEEGVLDNPVAGEDDAEAVVVRFVEGVAVGAAL